MGSHSLNTQHDLLYHITHCIVPPSVRIEVGFFMGRGIVYILLGLFVGADALSATKFGPIPLFIGLLALALLVQGVRHIKGSFSKKGSSNEA